MGNASLHSKGILPAAMPRASIIAGSLVLLACVAEPVGEPSVIEASRASVEPAAFEHVEPPTAPPAWATLAEVEHWLPGPADHAQQFDPARARLDQQCRGCHVEHAREWAESQHATAWSSAAFQRAFALEPLGFCQGCHAPETSPREPVPEAAAALGVGCVSCHVEPGTERVWAVGEARASEAAPHSIVRSPAFAGPQACAGCHEFGFPDNALRDEPLAMQATIREHAASARNAQACADCHMPIRGEPGHRSHAFVGAYDRELLARSLNISSERLDPRRVRLTLSPGEVGHAVPTGDLLRRLEVALLEVDAQGRERVIDRRWLGREFASRPHRNGLTLRDELSDTRVGPQGRALIFELPADAGPNLVWRVRHQRVAHGGSHPRKAAIEGEIEFARGSVPGP